MHLAELLVEAGRFLLRFLDFLLLFLDFDTDFLELTLLFEGVEGAASLLHGLSEPFVPEKPIDDVSTAQILNLLDVGLDLILKLLDLSLVLLGKFFDILIEESILSLLGLAQGLVLGQQFDLFLEDVLVVGSHRVENLILSAVFLHHLAVHLVEVAFGFLHEFDDFAAEVGGVLVTAEERDLFLELVVLLP